MMLYLNNARAHPAKPDGHCGIRTEGG